MTTEFTNNGIRYSLLSAPRGRWEPIAECSTSTASVWANAQQKAKYTNGLDKEFLGRHVTEATEGTKRRPIIEIKPAPAAHFLESAPRD
jgi:hypothetical protein